MIHWEIFADAETVAAEAAERIEVAARQAIGARNCFRIVLAGGTTPERTYRRLRAAENAWSQWVIFFGDERCLPEGHPSRNSTMAQRAWLAHVPIPAANVHTIPAELGPDEGARVYASSLKMQLPFDMVLLGVGEDGHTASLFPGAHHPDGELVHPVHAAPKPPPQRISLSRTALSQTRALLVLVTGVEKRFAIRAWRTGVPLPIAELQPACGVTVLMDAAAAGAPD